MKTKEKKICCDCDKQIKEKYRCVFVNGETFYICIACDDQDIEDEMHSDWGNRD